MNGIGSNETDLSDFGPLGDIYGSLNTLFTSATLIIVMYSAYLQRQANKDVRLSMEEQLKQAKDDSKAQLDHAKEALDRQLQQQEISNQNQLKIAEQSRLTQVRESKDAIFSSTFFNLLNYKEVRFNNISVEIDKKFVSATDIFFLFQEKFFSFLEENSDLSTLDEEDIRVKIDNLFDELNPQLADIVHDYMGVYWSLIELVKNSHYDWDNKIYYIRTISESMRVCEQVAFFAISPFVYRFRQCLEDSGFFGAFYHESFIDFALRFHKSSHFWTNTWEDVFDKNPIKS
ncbi:hypothetical protein HMPREF0012_03018 [Acinetobacter calcoaceticus RUH2202]|nr:hypothetical protein HMPREF0012_03018 [Acinetobacter calcoaceticus RUH2202]